MACRCHVFNLGQALSTLFGTNNGSRLVHNPAANSAQHSWVKSLRPGPVFCLLLGVSLDYAQPITGQVTEVTCPVIGRAQPELTPSKRQKTGPGDACIRQRIESSLVQVLACSLFGAKPLLESKLTYCQLDKLQWNSNHNTTIWECH